MVKGMAEVLTVTFDSRPTLRPFSATTKSASPSPATPWPSSSFTCSRRRTSRACGSTESSNSVRW